MTIGPSIGDELKAAGVDGLPFAWNPQTGQLRTDDPALTPAQRTTIQAVFAAHDPAKPSADDVAKLERVAAREKHLADLQTIETGATTPVAVQAMAQLLREVLTSL